VAEHPQTNRRDAHRLTVSEAAGVLGISTGAVRNRINRGTLEAERVEGTVYVLLSSEQLADIQRAPAETPADYPGEYNALTSALEARIESLERQRELLERQLEQANERERQAEDRDRENRRLLAAALERIPAQLEAPERPPEDTETGAEAERVESPAPGQREPWWRRWFGG
jgi:excisionase family DNA binding protein